MATRTLEECLRDPAFISKVEGIFGKNLNGSSQQAAEVIQNFQEIRGAVMEGKPLSPQRLESMARADGSSPDKIRKELEVMKRNSEFINALKDTDIKLKNACEAPDKPPGPGMQRF